MQSTVIKISDFIKTKYRDFWKDTNINKNTFFPQDEMMSVEKRIVWAAYKIGMGGNDFSAHKTVELSGEVSKYHISGIDSINDSIKGLATSYKRQPCCRILKGLGNFGFAAGDSGAAARYTNITGTPLLSAMIKDLPFIDMISDETGLEQPHYIPTLLPMTLINGASQIGTGKSTYYDERDARKVIDWIEELQKNPNAIAPEPISTTGCKVYRNLDNGYTYYDAIIHSEGRFDIITALPPKISTNIVITNLKKKLPTKIGDKIFDGSGEGKPTWIMVPKGHLEEKDWTKYSLRTARKEATYIWDEELDTMRMSNLNEVAILWFNYREKIVIKRLKNQILVNKKEIHKISLIKIYAEKEMNKWKEEQIIKEFGSDDASLVLKQIARAFLPANLKLNEINRIKMEDKNINYTKDIKNIGNVILSEARDIIVKQEKFFAKI